MNLLKQKEQLTKFLSNFDNMLRNSGMSNPSIGSKGLFLDLIDDLNFLISHTPFYVGQTVKLTKNIVSEKTPGWAMYRTMLVKGMPGTIKEIYLGADYGFSVQFPIDLCVDNQWETIIHSLKTNKPVVNIFTCYKEEAGPLFYIQENLLEPAENLDLPKTVLDTIDLVKQYMASNA